MKCDRCGSANVRPKTIISKNGKAWNGFECLNGCKNDKNPNWLYFFFPPKETQPKTENEGMALLRTINSKLDKLIGMQNTSRPGQIPIRQDELQPDEEVPF